MNDIENDFFCVFKTDLEKPFQLPPSKHTVPGSVTHSELNDIVNQLLRPNQGVTERKFDFLVKGELLVGSIKSHLAKLGVTGEQTIEVFYTKSIGKPQVDSSVDVTNGIARLFTCLGSGKSDPPLNVCCSFNNLVSVFDSKLQTVSACKLGEYFHDFSETVLAFEFQQTMASNVLLASNDFGDFAVMKFTNNLKGLKLLARETNSCPITTFSLNSVEDVVFLTGDNQGCLKIWNLENGSLRTKTEQEGAHHGRVMKACFATTSEVYSIGFDDSFKIFDTTSLVNVFYIYFKDCLPTAFDFSLRNNSILTGHVNGTIRMFDERARDKTTKRVFKSHNCFLSSLKVNPSNEQVFISADYSGKIKVWDLRSDFPIYTIEGESEQKIFDLEWVDEKRFLSGNSEGLLVSHSFV